MDPKSFAPNISYNDADYIGDYGSLFLGNRVARHHNETTLFTLKQMAALGDVYHLYTGYHTGFHLSIVCSVYNKVVKSRHIYGCPCDDVFCLKGLLCIRRYRYVVSGRAPCIFTGVKLTLRGNAFFYTTYIY